MLLRSSSTPAVQTVFSDGPNRDCDPCTAKPSFLPGVHRLHLHFSSFSCNSSPISPSPFGSSEFDPKSKPFRPSSFRRAHSDSNLEGLLASRPSFYFDSEEICGSKSLTRYFPKRCRSMLRTEPSFSIYNSSDELEEENKIENLLAEKSVESDGCLQRSVTIGESIDALGSGRFSFGNKSMVSIEESDGEEEEETLNGVKNLSFEEEAEPASYPMYLATGLGLGGDGFGGGGGDDFTPTGFDEGGDVEEYYRRMVAQDPSNPLFLRNYAQLLQSKEDLPGAEEYFFRAALADPQDGEISMQYAKLVWELHHDQDRALTYYRHAVQAAPQDSHVLAAYASFLWEIEEDDSAEQTEEEESFIEPEKTFEEEKRPTSPPIHIAAGLGIDVAGFGAGINTVNYMETSFREGGNVEEYHRRMVEESPCSPLILGNYARFLHQTKRDLQGAEEYYSRAILVDPRDGEIISQYAQLVWELHHDHAKASSYFVRAVQATPADSHVLAAYAKFLWETEDEKEHSASQSDIGVPLFEAATN